MAALSIVSEEDAGCDETDHTMLVQSRPAFPDDAVASSTMSSQLPIFPAEERDTRGVTGLFGFSRGRFVISTGL
jgi:hypothetical protein